MSTRISFVLVGLSLLLSIPALAEPQTLSETSGIIGFAYRLADAGFIKSTALTTCLETQLEPKEVDAWKKAVATACRKTPRLKLVIPNLVCRSNSYQIGAYSCEATLASGRKLETTGPKAQALWTALSTIGGGGDAATGRYFMGASKISLDIDFDGQVNDKEESVELAFDDSFSN